MSLELIDAGKTFNLELVQDLSNPASIGWLLRNAVLSDLIGLGSTPISLTYPGNLVYTVDNGGVAAIICEQTGFNAIQFDIANPDVNATFIVVAKGSNGFSVVGDYVDGILNYARSFDTVNGTEQSHAVVIGTINAISINRFRVANVNGSVRIESWNGSAWIVAFIGTITAQSSFTPTYKEDSKVGFAFSLDTVQFSNIKTGMYIPPT